MQAQRTDVAIVMDDLSEELRHACLKAGTVAWDIETTGLDWSSDRIATCQIAVPDRIALVQLQPGARPRLLMDLLADAGVRKVFHHAPFDARFMTHQWGVRPANLACTKVASKILDPQLPTPEHSLMPVLARTMGVAIRKDQRLSDWGAAVLTEDQRRYAADDVRHLLRLHELQMSEAATRGLLDLLESSFAYLPTRVALDLRGVGDVYTY